MRKTERNTKTVKKTDDNTASKDTTKDDNTTTIDAVASNDKTEEDDIGSLHLDDLDDDNEDNGTEHPHVKSALSISVTNLDGFEFHRTASGSINNINITPSGGGESPVKKLQLEATDSDIKPSIQSEMIGQLNTLFDDEVDHVVAIGQGMSPQAAHIMGLKFSEDYNYDTMVSDTGTNSPSGIISVTPKASAGGNGSAAKGFLQLPFGSSLGSQLRPQLVKLESGSQSSVTRLGKHSRGVSGSQSISTIANSINSVDIKYDQDDNHQAADNDTDIEKHVD